MIRDVFGLTGGIASGKSTVARFFAEAGVHVIDADQLSREVMRPGEDCYDEIVRTFGEDFLTEDRQIDRKKLGRLVFRFRDTLLKRLERIQWEHIHSRFIEKSLKLDGLICYEASQLVESNYWVSLRPLVVVDIDFDLQLQRLMARSSLTEEEAKIRIASQNPGRAIAHADYLIHNNGDLANLRARSLAFLQARPILDRWRTGDAETY